MPLQIEVGKKYRTRSGDVVEIVGEDSHHECPFLGRFVDKKMSRFFPTNGKWGSPQSEQPFDLIEELPDDGDLLTKK